MNQSENYRELLLNNTALLDVRAPIEFSKGAFPNSHNFPLLDNEQRAAIGTRYKEQGQQAAIALGWTLATPNIKKQRIDSWVKHIKENPNGFLYCFRGGLRSHLSQKLLKDEVGIDYPLVTGGYKAMRRFLIDELERSYPSMDMVVISGRTGAGKTIAINRMSQSVDLEGLAKHRGSAFGRHIDSQPSQINFENELSVKVMRLLRDYRTKPLIFCEDESKQIGKITVPAHFLQHMKSAPVVILETPLEERIDITLKSYLEEDFPLYLRRFGEDGIRKFKEQVMSNVTRIRKKLGEENYKTLYSEFENALNEFERTGNSEFFRPGIKLLLTKYYDPMYDYGISKKEDKVIFRGDKNELHRWVKDYSSLGG